MPDENVERVNMNWPNGLKDRVKAYAGARGLTEFTVTAVEVRLVDENRVQALESEVSELRYLVQLLADRYVMGGDHENREAFLMELTLPTWLSTEGWPENLARQVPREHVPLPAAEPVTEERVPSLPPAPVGQPTSEPDVPDNLEVAQEEMVEATAPQDEDLHKPMFMTGGEAEGAAPAGDMFERLRAKAAEKGIDVSGAGLVPASKVKAPPTTFHFTGPTELVGLCGEAGSTTNTLDYVTCEQCKAKAVEPTDVVHESGEAFVEHLEKVSAAPVARSLDDIDVDF